VACVRPALPDEEPVFTPFPIATLIGQSSLLLPIIFPSSRIDLDL
jgi:hypothetical protein